MNYYFECFNKKICLNLYHEASSMLYFWVKRFCPNVKIIKEDNNKIECDFIIEFIESKKYNYIIDNNCIKIYGILTDNESYIAKFITQCFQKMLIEDDILIIPSSCISKDNNAILIIGDFWQGKTSVAINIAKEYKLNLVSDNYVAIKNGYVIGSTSYISIRKEDINEKLKSIYNVNDRYFYESYDYKNRELKIVGFLLPYINNGDNNIHIISKEESKWYLYQKFIRLLCGETILFDGKLPSPIFLDKEISQKILKIVESLLINNEIKYASTSMEKIVEEGIKILNKGEMINE